MSKQKTSISLRGKTLRKLKKEAKRQRRSVSNVVEIWIEDEFAKNGELKIPADFPGGGAASPPASPVEVEVPA